MFNYLPGIAHYSTWRGGSAKTDITLAKKRLLWSTITLIGLSALGGYYRRSLGLVGIGVTVLSYRVLSHIIAQKQAEPQANISKLITLKDEDQGYRDVLCDALLKTSEEVRTLILDGFRLQPIRFHEFFQQCDVEKIPYAVEVMGALKSTGELSFIAAHILVECPKEIFPHLLKIIPLIFAQKELTNDTFEKLVTRWCQIVFCLVQASNKRLSSCCDEALVEDMEYVSEIDPNWNIDEDEEQWPIIVWCLPPGCLSTIIGLAVEWKGDRLGFYRLAMRENSDTRTAILEHWRAILNGHIVVSGQDSDVFEKACLLMFHHPEVLGIHSFGTLYPSIDVEPKILKKLLKRSLEFSDTPPRERAQLITLLAPYLQSIGDHTDSVIELLRKIPVLEREQVMQAIAPFYRLKEDGEWLVELLKIMAKIPSHSRNDLGARVDRFIKVDVDVLDDSSDSSFSEDADEDEIVLWRQLAQGLACIDRNEWEGFFEALSNVFYHEDEIKVRKEWKGYVNVLQKKIRPSQDDVELIVVLPSSFWPMISQDAYIDKFIKNAELCDQLFLGWIDILKSDNFLRAQSVFRYILENYNRWHVNAPDLLDEMKRWKLRQSSLPDNALTDLLGGEQVPLQTLQAVEALEEVTEVMNDLEPDEQVQLLAAMKPYRSNMQEKGVFSSFLEELEKVAAYKRVEVAALAQPYILNLYTYLERFKMSLISKYIKCIGDIPRGEGKDVLSKVDQYLHEEDEDAEESEGCKTHQLSSRYQERFNKWSCLVKHAGLIPSEEREYFIEIIGRYLSSADYSSIAVMATLLPPQTWYDCLHLYAEYLETEDKHVHSSESNEVVFFQTLQKSNPDLWDAIVEGWSDILEEETIQSSRIRDFTKRYAKELNLL